MIRGDIHKVERLALRAGVGELRPVCGKREQHEQNSILLSGLSDLVDAFSDHDHSEESAQRIREDLTALVASRPAVQGIAEAVAAVIDVRMPPQPPRRATGTRLLTRIYAVAVEEAALLYPNDTDRQTIAAVLTYCALVIHGPPGAPLPWEEPIIAQRILRRLSLVPTLRDVTDPDR